MKGFGGENIPVKRTNGEFLHLRKARWYSKDVLVAFEDRIVVFNLSANPWIN